DVIAPLRLEQALQSERLERGTRSCKQLASVDRFGEVGIGALAEPGFDRGRLPASRREHDDRRAAPPAQQKTAQDFNAVHAGHRHVQQYELRLALIALTQRLFAA